MATPTLPSYITTCLQLIKTSASGKPKTPLSFVDTVASSLSKIIPLFPATSRPFSTQVTATLRDYIAPTTSSPYSVPQCLRESARRALILLHYTAPKNGNSDEWVKSIRGAIRCSHNTADQIFRAIHESWESTTGYTSQPVRLNENPSGGGDSHEELPAWTGLSSGAERLSGLLEFLAEHLRVPTKASVALPLGELLDLTARISLVTLPVSNDSTGFNPAISKDERAELWTVLPDIHAATLYLLTAILHRLQSKAISLSTDIVDQMIRILISDRDVSAAREASYILSNELLRLSGPTFPKLTVDLLAPLIRLCCQDTLRPTGYGDSKKQESPALNGSKSKDPSSSNADAFLAAPNTTANSSPTAPPLTHEETALNLLPLLFSYLPQKYLSPDSRALLDRTAILATSKPAMLASCLHPYNDSRGRYYPNILPFLVRQFPHDQDVEVLRTNLLRSSRQTQVASQTWEDPRDGLDALLQPPAEDVLGPAAGTDVGMEAIAVEKAIKASSNGFELSSAENKIDIDPAPAAENAFFTAERTMVVTASVSASANSSGVKGAPMSPLKRKASQVDPGKEAKRVDTGKVDAAVMRKTAAEENSDDDSDSDGSIEIDMTMDDDEYEDEDEYDGDE